MSDTLIDLEAFAGVHQSWLSHRTGTGRHDDWASSMAGMEAARRRIVGARAWTAGPSTLFGVLDLTRNEVQNCRVLRWLLDPLARHGVGALLIESLCARFDVSICEPELARVSAEVTRDATRADLVLEGLGDGRMLVIEAKIDAAEGLQQALRLETLWPEAERLGFLTVGGSRLPFTASDRKRWRPISWEWFADEVIRLLNEVGHDPQALDARRAAADWAAGTKRSLSS